MPAVSRAVLALCLLLPLAISPWGFDHAILVKESLLLLVAGTLFILFFLGVATERGFSFKATPLGKPILLLVACAIVSIFQAVNLPAALHRLALILAGILLFYAIIHARLDRAQNRAFANAVLASAFVATLYAFLQYIHLDPLFPPTVDLSSTLGNPNFLAEYLICAIPLSLALALCSEGAIQRLLYGLGGLFLFAGLLLTAAKAASLGFIFSLVVFALLWKRQRTEDSRGSVRRLFLLAVLGLGLVGLFGYAFFTQFAGPGGVGGILERYATSRAVYYEWRLVFYRDSLRMALDNPLFGVGIGNFQFAYPRYRSMPETLDPKDFILDHAHNDYLELWAEVGFGGLIALLWLLWTFFREMFHSRQASILACGYAASVGAIAVNSLFAFGIYNPVPLAMFWLSMGLALPVQASSVMEEDQSSRVTPSLRPPLWAVLVAVPIISVLLYATVRPLVADAYLSRGYEHLAKGRPNQAIPLLDHAALLSPARLDSQVYLATALSEARRPQEANTILDRYLAYDPHNYQIHYLLGVFAEQIGNDEAAIEAYERARRIYPLYSRPFLRVGMIRERRRDIKGAMDAYREAIRLNPALAEASNNLAILLSAEGKLDEAIRVWEEGTRGSPQDLVIAENLATAYSRKGEREKAVAWAARAEKLRVGGKR